MANKIESKTASAPALNDATAASNPPAVPAVKTDAESAAEIVALIASGLLTLRSEAAKAKAGALALKESARMLGGECSEEGRPSLEAWQVFCLLASCVNPTLRLRMECADIARNAARKRLSVLEKFSKDANLLDRALDRVAKITGKSAQHNGDANISAKFGVPAKVSAVFE